MAYGRPLPDGKTYKELMLERLPLDLSRVHFTGLLPYPDYLKVLQASSVHVYLTRPFVLSWSMLEAMSVGCVIVGSATPQIAGRPLICPHQGRRRRRPSSERRNR